MNTPSEQHSSATVVIANGDQPIGIPPDRVYFAFASGRLTYDCVSCGAQCCRGHGFEVLAGRELLHQSTTHHPIRFFLDPCESGATDHLHARNLQPACFFLNEQNLCSIQLSHGYAAKPETCRLFPFNEIRQSGDFLIVAPHRALCPLRVVPAGDRSEASDHGQLLAAMSASGIGTHVPQTSIASVAMPALVALERQLVELCEQDLGATRYARNAIGQLALARLAQVPAAAQDTVWNQARDDVEDFLWSLYDVLGAAQPVGNDDDRALVRTMIGMTPSIRARLIFGEGWGADPDSVERIPYLLLALYTLATFAREAGMGEVTYQSVMNLFDAYRPLLNLLAVLDRVMVWKPTASVGFAMTRDRALRLRYLGVAKALLASAQRRAPAPLGRILSEHAGSAQGLDRVMFLKRLARELQGQIEPISPKPAARRRLHLSGAAIRQWGLGYFSTDFLMTVADAQSRRAEAAKPAKT
jgi:Fe-S-cluster containining protein